MNTKYITNIFNFYYLIATLLGIGRIPFIPGTLGSLFAVFIWYIGYSFFINYYLVIIILSIITGILTCEKIFSYTGEVYDYKFIVWDECIGIWISFINISKKDFFL